jgi:hypothetical protein
MGRGQIWIGRKRGSLDGWNDVKQGIARALLVWMQGGGDGDVEGIDNVEMSNIRSENRTDGFQATEK